MGNNPEYQSMYGTKIDLFAYHKSDHRY